jgi:biotin carboxyl carrier protein
MRKYRITIGDQTYVVEIEDPQASPVQVQVDGKPFQVYVDWEGTDDGAAVTPEVCQSSPGEPAAPPAVQSPRVEAGPRARESADAAADTLVAPMPGTILAVAVREGERVAVGQEVCVLEAMKMKNSIKSPREGTIAEVAVGAGATVAHGDVLVRFA